MKFLKVWVSLVAISLFMALALTGCGGGGGSSAPIIPPSSGPAAPTNVQAAGGSNQITVSWAAVSGATSYNIYYATASGVTKTNSLVQPVIGGSSTSFPLTNLANATTYYIAVTAVNSSNQESALSTEVNATTSPSGPTDLQAIPANASVTLNWTTVANATAYKVYRAVGTNVFSLLTTVNGGSTLTFTDTPVTNGVTYTYQVSAMVNNVETGRSYQITVIPSATPTLANPIGVSAKGQNVTPLEVFVSWTAVTGATGYNVYRSTSPITSLSGLTPIVSNTQSLTFGDNTVTFLNNPPLPYYYVVTALNANGESAPSANAIGLYPGFTNDMVSGKTVKYTETDGNGSDTLTVVCSSGTSATFSGTLGGKAVSGTGTWEVPNGVGALNLTLPNGTTATFTWTVGTISTSNFLPNVAFISFGSGSAIPAVSNNGQVEIK